MFRRTILGLALALSAAIPARAATISITSDKIAYQTGEQILLTVTGDAEGAAGYGVYGRLVYAGSMTNTLGSTQEALSSGAQTWMTGDLAYGEGYAEVLNQIAGLEPLSPGAFTSTVSLLATAPGDLTVGWSNSGTTQLEFFGATGAPITVSIAGESIEPPPPPPPVQPPPSPIASPLNPPPQPPPPPPIVSPPPIQPSSPPPAPPVDSPPANDPIATTAATVTITANKASYTTGESITLTVTGDAAGEEAYGGYGRLAYSALLTDTLGSSALPMTSDGQEWMVGVLSYGDGYAEVINQIYGLEPATPDEPFVGTVTLLATAPGDLTIYWSQAYGAELDFFGASAPSISLSISGAGPSPAPEPSSALLFGLGLVVARVAVRRRAGR